jgi:hypothetical protein
MISKLFEDLRMQSFVALLFFSVLGIVGLLAQPLVHTFSFDFYDWQWHSTLPNLVFLSGVLLILGALWLNTMLTQQFEILRRNVFVGWYLMLLFLGTWGFTGMLTGMIEFFVLLVAFGQMFHLTNPGKNYQLLYNIGWCVAVLSMFHAAYLWLLLPFLLSVFAYGNVGWRSIALPIFGVVMWLFIVFTVFYLANQQAVFLKHYGSIRVFGAFFPTQFSALFYGWVAMLGAFFLLQLGDFFQLSNRANIYKRQAFSSVLLFFLATLFISLFVSNNTAIFFPFLILPLAIFFANMRQYAKNKWYRLFVMWALPLFILFGFLLQVNSLK